MIIKKKRKEFNEEPTRKKKNVKAVIKIEEDIPAVIKVEDDGQLETDIRTKIRKKEHFKGEFLDQLQPKNNKKNKKKKVDSELLKKAYSGDFVNVKAHLDSELQEESKGQIKILKKKKKKAPCHFSLEEGNDSSDLELLCHHTGGIKKTEFSFKKPKKNTALDLELDGVVTKKKKKKGSSSFSLKDIEDSVQKQSERAGKTPHKYISPEGAFTGENHDTENVQSNGESCVRRKKGKKKKKKVKSDSFLPLVVNQDSIYGVPGRPVALSDLRKRKKQNSWEITLANREEEDTSENSGSIKETKKRKHRSNYVSSSAWENQPYCSHSIPGKYLPAQQEVDSEEEELSGKKSRKNVKGSTEVIKKKKKKNTHKKEEETTYSNVSLNSDNASKSQKTRVRESNKKNKESEMEQAEHEAVDGPFCNSNHMFCDRKGKKRKKGPPQDFAEQPGSTANPKKTKLKTEDTGSESLGQLKVPKGSTYKFQKEHLDGIVFVQEKKGNCDEVNIDKVRRQALQEEIDRESGKTKGFSSKVGQDMKFGQWSTAAFKSSEEEMKFFRLMGGFKKGSVPTQNLPTTTAKPNMALNREGQEKLQQALRMEFDKAMDLKQHRGIGLGFQPTANKRVYIDKYTSRSIKFED